MLSLENIQSALQDRNLRIVANATGLHYNTLRNIRDGININPQYRVMMAISQYLESRP